MNNIENPLMVTKIDDMSNASYINGISILVHGRLYNTLYKPDAIIDIIIINRKRMNESTIVIDRIMNIDLKYIKGANMHNTENTPGKIERDNPMTVATIETVFVS
jgi:hypothetical protein